jgi:hypothetical protein
MKSKRNENHRREAKPPTTTPLDSFQLPMFVCFELFTKISKNMKIVFIKKNLTTYTMYTLFSFPVNLLILP